jgi:hypothetical protein
MTLATPNVRQAATELDERGNQVHSRSWFLFFKQLGDRILMPLPGATVPAVVTLGASPATYVAPEIGVVLVVGGTVSLIELGRGTVFTNAGIAAGPVPVSRGDSVRVTYTAAPVVTYVSQ